MCDHSTGGVDYQKTEGRKGKGGRGEGKREGEEEEGREEERERRGGEGRCLLSTRLYYVGYADSTNPPQGYDVMVSSSLVVL